MPLEAAPLLADPLLDRSATKRNFAWLALDALALNLVPGLPFLERLTPTLEAIARQPSPSRPPQKNQDRSFYVRPEARWTPA
ncbi:MAG: hypothetical protein MUF64_06840 [Polyangiaceae bacterium]|jgi:hypothetical protein|nr:hypothetical protein [Polyangiaceae bacterium]